ncbi:MAG: hypothetical protein K0R58_2321 [Ramlibacter sp.]|jgi:hypothetical protein|nr:hypothetical protein [Ramlibacter sp.]
MLHFVSAWTRSMRCEIRRRTIQRRLLEVVARLPYEPERRVAYQHLVDDYMRLAQPSRFQDPR